MIRLNNINIKSVYSYQQQELIGDIMDSRRDKLGRYQAQEKSDAQLDSKKRLREIKPSKLNYLEKKSDLTVHKMSLKKKQPIKQPGQQTRGGVVF